jgi:hypothetical protein
MMKQIRCFVGAGYQPARLFLLLFVLLLSTISLRADTHITSPAYADVSKAVADAAPGDTVLVLAGTATWTSGLVIIKSVKLIGAGIDSTIIKNGILPGTFLITLSPAVPADNPYMEISGFTLDGNNLASCISIYATDNAYPFTNFRIHHNKIKNVPDSPDAYMSVRVKGDCFGLIDNNNFVHNLYDFKIYGNQKSSWDKYPGLENIGTKNYLYIEDNTSIGAINFILTSGEGARWVYRHNTIDNSIMSSGNTVFDAHGDTQNYGVVAHEIYNNTVIADVGSTARSGFRLADYRGGTGIIYNNTTQVLTSGSRSPITVREEYNPRDGVNGCWDPVNNGYIWNNRNSINNSIISVEEVDAHNCIAEDTDWWDDAIRGPGGESPSNFNYGTAANRPSTSANNDCYWETDTKRLYRSIGANNWIFIYTPYTYPHPLALTSQDIFLTPGWNWISFNVLPGDISLSSVFTDVLSQVEQVKSQTQSAIHSNNAWKGDLTDLGGIGSYKMYKVKVSSACTLTATGTAISPTSPITLQTGWNWVTYLPTTSMSIATALDSIKSKVIQVKSRTQSATYSGSVWSGTLTQLEPGQGYAIKMSAPGILTYPAAASMLLNQQRKNQ